MQPSMQQPSMQPGQAPQPSYTFRPQECQVLGQAAGAAKLLGIIFFIQVAFSLFGSNIVGAVIELVFGLLFFQGGKSLEAASLASTNDVAHLMSALDKFSTAFQIRVIFAWIFVGILGLGLSGAILFAVFGRG